MLKDLNLLFLGVRLFVFIFFLLLSLGKSPQQTALVVVPAVLYLSLSLYTFFYTGRLRLFKRYGDALFISLLALLSQSKEAIFSLVIPMVMHANRTPSSSFLTLWLLIALGYYYYGVKSLTFLPLFVALYLSPMYPELIESLRKERNYIKKLRRAYQSLTKDLSVLKGHAEKQKEDSVILEVLLKSKTLEEYLRNIKSHFELRSISVLASKEVYEERKVDMASGSLHVAVKLEKGSAYVVFYMNNPMELYDKRLLDTLEKSAKLINLYIEGFEGGDKKAVKLAV
ncbi:MAG: hypothetical protein D6699_05365 [Aquificota bacterium]|nr:MAG: hypothetical protein D6699_05365 [Aquificota bacterium]